VLYEIWSLGHKPYENIPSAKVHTLDNIVCLLLLSWNIPTESLGKN